MNKKIRAISEKNRIIFEKTKCIQEIASLHPDLMVKLKESGISFDDPTSDDQLKLRKIFDVVVRCGKIYNVLLTKRDILPLFMGIHPFLDKDIERILKGVDS